MVSAVRRRLRSRAHRLNQRVRVGEDLVFWPGPRQVRICLTLGAVLGPLRRAQQGDCKAVEQLLLPYEPAIGRHSRIDQHK